MKARGPRAGCLPRSLPETTISVPYLWVMAPLASQEVLPRPKKGNIKVTSPLWGTLERSSFHTWQICWVVVSDNARNCSGVFLRLSCCCHHVWHCWSSVTSVKPFLTCCRSWTTEPTSVTSQPASCLCVSLLIHKGHFRKKPTRHFSY